MVSRRRDRYALSVDWLLATRHVSIPQLFSSSMCLRPARRSRRRTRSHRRRAPIRSAEAPIAVRRPTGDCSGHRIASPLAVQVVRRCLLVHCVASDAFEWRVMECRHRATRSREARCGGCGCGAQPSGWSQRCSGTARRAPDGRAHSATLGNTQHSDSWCWGGNRWISARARKKKKKKEKPPIP